MAIAFLLSKAAGASTTSTSYPLTGFSALIPAGSLIVCCLGNNSAANTFTACSDNSTQAGTANAYTIRTVLAQANGTGGLAWCYTTRDILTTDTLTMTAGTGISRRSWMMMAFSGTDPAPLDVTAKVENVAASPVTMGATAALAGTGELAVAYSCVRASSSAMGFTDSSGYNAVAGVNSGGTSVRVEVNGAYQLNVGTAAETDAHAYTTFTSGCGELLTFKAAAAAAASLKTGIHVVARVWGGR